MNKLYDFETIISSEDFRKNRERILNQEKTTKKKYKLKAWVKITLWMILGVLIGIAIYQMATVKTVKSTPVGEYSCQGGLIKVCTGSKEVANYLGV